LDKVTDELRAEGGEAHSFVVEAYDHANIAAVFKRISEHWPESRIKCAVWNTAQWSRIPFLDVKPEDIELSVQINIVASFAFSQEAIKAMLASSPSGEPGGTLLFTGATSATRGAANFATFAAGKHGVRALSQSLAREFGKRNIHVAHIIIDGVITTDRTRTMFGGKPKIVSTPGADTAAAEEQNWVDDEAQHLTPEAIARTYLYLHLQERSAWTQELDLRPAKEHF
jgi:NAD(P)-dependent dehydrogenase (short-subunit alcohol dehydrogenase family)